MGERLNMQMIPSTSLIDGYEANLANHSSNKHKKLSASRWRGIRCCDNWQGSLKRKLAYNTNMVWNHDMTGRSDEAPVTNGDDNDYVTGSVYKNRTESDLLLSSSLKSVFGSPQLGTNVLCVWKILGLFRMPCTVRRAPHDSGDPVGP